MTRRHLRADTLIVWETATGNELTLHLVNYNREEPPKNAKGEPSAGGGISGLRPRSREPIRSFLENVANLLRSSVVDRS